ncbi:uncharacterized protein METZ01_LOCUS201506, partial [marine metagenome]
YTGMVKIGQPALSSRSRFMAKFIPVKLLTLLNSGCYCPSSKLLKIKVLLLLFKNHLRT